MTSVILPMMNKRAMRACDKRCGHDLGCDPGNLDVHLQSGDTRFGSGHFEVHVAQMIFQSLDVGQNGVFSRLL